jgi:tRNA dimethylallyltransferase
VLAGPTASGKTAVSLLLAPRLGAEIISADSRQVYSVLDIGTAKPSPDERSSVPHHFVGELLPDEGFNAGTYGIRGREVAEELFRRGKVPLVVGGSGLYIQALVDGFFEGVPADPEIREGLERRLREEGAQALLDELGRVDPVSAARMLPTNSRRIVRALEVHRVTGIPISELQKNRSGINFHAVFAGLRWDRKLLYDRINRRVDRMIGLGLVDEAKELRARGYGPHLTALQTPGYTEVFAHLDGLLSYEEMVSLIKRNSRRYAKRQLTWFRKDARIRWFDLRGEEDIPEAAEQIAGYFLASA